MYQRKQTKEIHSRLTEKGKFIQVVLGPRQSGKTTAIKQILKETKLPYHYAAADKPEPSNSNWISEQWGIGRAKAAEGKRCLLVLDEIQKISKWSDEVKRLWDEDKFQDREINVVILGSSALLMQKGLTESLAGRFEIVPFPHWSWEECRDAFGVSLDEYIYFGGYPAGFHLIKDEKRWKQYILDSMIETAISKDLLYLTRIEKPAILRQLFVLACEYGGESLSYQKMVGQLQDVGNTTTIAHYQHLLEGAFLIKGLSKWSGNKLRKRNSSPKWLPLNTGLMTALADKTFDEYRQDLSSWGRLFEVTVGAHLFNQSREEGYDLYYWREGIFEVDYVLKNKEKLLAIEVKSGRKRASLPGFRKFRDEYPKAAFLVVGEQGLKLENFLETPLKHLMV